MATLEHALSEITKALLAPGGDPTPAAFNGLAADVGRLLLTNEKLLRKLCARHIEAAYGKRRHEYDSLRAALESARWQVTEAIVKLGNTEAEAQKAVRKVWSSALEAERDKRGMKRAMMKGW
jgi:hypothetical protein